MADTVSPPLPVRLHLGAHAPTAGLDLSGVAVAGDTMFLAPDEGSSLLRLRRVPGGSLDWEDPQEVPLHDAVGLRGTPEDEVDAEGLDVVDGCLWVAGSHSAKRRRIRPETPTEDVGERLARVTPEKSRRVLARLPLREGPDGPVTVPAGEEVRGLGVAARLPSGKRGLWGALRDDEHLGPFLGIPGKDNGFDVEGVAVRDAAAGGGVVLGLRGPVLRGWAVLLEVAVHADGTELVLDDMAKCFVDLEGLGVRDLARDGDDLLVLAGPTMVLDGPARVLRLPGGAAGPLPPAIRAEELTLVTEVAVGRGCDRPEGLAALPEGLLVLHDTPAPHRLDGEHLVGDLWAAPM
ncbi:DUF3616 domain-containing protein [Actinomycetospora straminea]|uniref:DUF3616 domain-containing protein n=1 Tax=Actinomycetospora straminea TaxID=663607 RepID=A0ABP9DYA3_9PSEU|nr:DUF3616 domain-containing protein [Actinomycetospora straminea]MDD7935227.1 DUF3616 domain-containing protein [Actinomycetospora straminea]